MSDQSRIRIRYRYHSTPYFDFFRCSPGEMAAIVEDTGWTLRRVIEAAAGQPYVGVIEKTQRHSNRAPPVRVPDVTGTTAGSVRSADGTTIAFWRSGAGPPLVLIHGTAADHNRWTAAARVLEPSFTVYSVDRRGRGGSGDAQDYALEREVEDVAAVVEGIGEPVMLVGHSYGGICSLEATSRSAGVERLVLYEPPIPTSEDASARGSLERLEELLAAGDPEALLTAFLTDMVHVSPAGLELMRSLPSWPARVAAAHTLVRETQALERYRLRPGRLRDWSTPTLLLQGGDSPEFFAAAIEALHRALPGSSVRVLEGQQHIAMDTATELFADELVRFAG